MLLRYICFIIFLISSTVLPAQLAPLTTAGRVTDAIPGDTSVPVALTVDDFTDIGQFTLTLKFDTTHVKFTSSASNSSLPGMTINYTPPSENPMGKIVLSWTGASNVTLADGSSIADLTFHYVTGTGLLNWSYTFGSICRYKRYDGGTLVTLNDSPKYEHYLDGGISDRGAPRTAAPVIASPVPGPLPVAISTSDFVSIKSLTLYLEYDPAILAYQNSFTKNPAFDSNFIVGDNPGSDSNRLIVMQWFSTTPVSLADGAIICTLDFAYLTPTHQAAQLNWYDTGPTCEYADETGDVLIDFPGRDYYFNGITGPGLPLTWTGNSGNDWFDASNWDGAMIPDSLMNVVIPDVSPQTFPVIANPADCYSVMIENGAFLTISSSGSLIIRK